MKYSVKHQGVDSSFKMQRLVKDVQTSQRSFADLFLNQTTAWVVLLITLVFTLCAWWWAGNYVEQRAQDRFNFEVNNARHAIVKRMQEYEQVLRGGLGLFKSSQQVSRTEWREYVSNLEIQRYWPGIQGIGYAVMISPDNLENFTRSIRNQGFPEFSLHPVGDREQYSSIIFLEPFDWRNQRAFGYDMFSEETRRNAMILARDTGQPVVSGRVTLVQETDQDVQPGFLLYLPNYQNGMPVDTVEQRRKALLGFVYSPFRAKDLMQGILGSGASLLDFSLYDGKTAQEEALLYLTTTRTKQEGAAQFRVQIAIELAGRVWTAHLTSSAALENEFLYLQANLFGVSGLLMDLLLFAIIWSLSKSRKQIAQSRISLLLAEQIAQLGSWELDLTNDQLYWSEQIFRIFEIDPLNFKPSYQAFLDAIHPEDRAMVNQAYSDSLINRKPYQIDHRIVLSDGRVKYVQEQCITKYNAQGQPLKSLGTIQDITDIKLAERRNQRLSNLYLSSSRCNQAIMRSANRSQLFEQMCRLIVALGEMKMAWIGLIDPVDQSVKPVACYGDGLEYLDGIHITVDPDHPSGQGPTGTALREDRPYWCQDFQQDPATSAWRERGMLHGWKSVACLPLHQNGKVIGGLNIYSPVLEMFDEETRQLFFEMALNIDFALNAFEANEQRKKAEVALVESHDLLKTVINAVPVRIFWKDIDCCYMGSNLLFAQDAGESSPDALIGKNDYELCWHEQAELYQLDDRQVISSADPKLFFEEMQRSPQGDLIYLRTSKVPLKNSRAEVIGLLGIYEDITETKYLESRTKHFEAIVNSSDDAIMSTDMDGIILSWNPGAVAMFGYSAHDMIGSTIQKLVPEQRFAEHDVNLAQIKQGVVVKHFETQRFHRDGRLIDISVTMSPIRNRDGEIIGASKIVRDISQRKRDEAMLRKLSMAIEQSVNSIVITNLECKIEYVNQRFTEVTGYSAQEVLGQNPRLLQSSQTSREVYDELWNTLLKGNTWRGEFYNLKKHGELFIEDATILPLRDEHGAITHYVAIKEDITKQKRNAMELDSYRHHLEELVFTRTQELEQAKHSAEVASQAKSAFLANMSHEIRTPLNAIIGFAHLLRQQVEPIEHKDKLEKIIGSGKHLLSVINDILDLSKIEAEYLTLEEKPFMLSAVIDHVCSMMTERINKKGLALQLEFDPRLQNLLLLGDQLRLTQIVLNYVSNAIKFTEQGSITLQAQMLFEHQDQVGMRIEVRDTGIGISETQQQKLFNAFEQAETSITRKYGGTGLGLAISKKLAQLMGGDVGVSSREGQGSIFWLELGLKRLPIATIQNTEILPASTKIKNGAKILLAEDNEFNQEVAKLILEGLGLQIDIANNGAEAVEKAENQLYDLILMDVQMPGMDGLEATQRIRQLPKNQDLPILAMTANAFLEDRERCLNVGMNDFVPKPVEPERMQEILARWIPG